MSFIVGCVIADLLYDLSDPAASEPTPRAPPRRPDPLQSSPPHETVAAMRILLAVLALTLVGCSATRAPKPPADAVPEVGDAWFTWRANQLSLSEAEARARDAALPDGTDGTAPRPGTLDDATAMQAAILWNQECARCHGENGVPPPVAEGQVLPKTWGGMAAMGFLMGGDKMRAGIYETISEGKGSMAGWGDVLSREQIWALVAHIESF